MNKRFSMRNKLLIIFGLLVLAAASIEGFLAVRTASKAVTEKVEAHLIDKATDTDVRGFRQKRVCSKQTRR